tara:strand:+ start:20412 stop:21641 length:1230 start_codon:yes stop_codon:yes gene_type:complete
LHKLIPLFLLTFIFTNDIDAQNFTASFIKTVTFNTGENLNPIIPLGSKLLISFDDLEADQKNYHYFIEHFDYNWEVSNLRPTEFMNGFQSFELTEFDNSFGTYQNYTHHTFEFPNRNSRIKISGNYLLTILNEEDEICIQRRFIVYENLVVISAKVVRDRQLKNIDLKQVVQFSIYHPNVVINNPAQELKIKIIQNHDWNIVKRDIKPQYYKKNEITYNYNSETSFYGGNEFLNFDTKNFNGTNVNIMRTAFEDQYYNTYLYPSIVRNRMPYSYYPDINGGYTIRTLNGNEVSTESEYTNVHFYLDATRDLKENEDIYVYGSFNNYSFTEENRLKYNKDYDYLETSMLFKQGFYNYTYVIKQESQPIDIGSLEGSFQETENEYTILVYYHPFGSRIGRVVGMTSINSKN